MRDIIPNSYLALQVFSEWNEVLQVVEYALTANAVVFRTLQSNRCGIRVEYVMMRC